MSPVGRVADRRPASTHRVARPETAESSFASTPGVRRRMQLQRTRDTAPELALRQALHALGLRYRVDRAPIPGSSRRADIVFTRRRVAVYVDGCFWHGCPKHGRNPSSNPSYWLPKLARNKRRDRNVSKKLRRAGWRVLRIWTHALGEPEAIARKINSLLSLGDGQVKNGPHKSEK